MDLQAWFDSRMEEIKAKRFAESDQISLGQLYTLLGDVHPCTPIVIEKNGMLFNPETPDSYRGYYTDLAFDYHTMDETPSHMVSQVRDMLIEADGMTYEGYKGGDFVMSESTPLWVAQYGTCDGTAVTGIEVTDDMVIILTAKVE